MKTLEKLKIFLEWCKFNRLDINWSKTYFIFVTNKRVKLPNEIAVCKDIDLLQPFKVSITVLIFVFIDCLNSNRTLSQEDVDEEKSMNEFIAKLQAYDLFTLQ